MAPGFIDAHLHLLDGSLSLEELRLDDAETLASLTRRVSDWAAAHPDARWVTGEGWSYAAFADGLPTRAALDAVVPDRPAWLVSYDGHTGWANSAALRLANVTRQTKDPPGGAVVRDEKGEPTGALKESAMDLVGRLVPKILSHEKERALRNGIARAAAWGLTTVHQAGIDEDELDLLSRVLEAVPRLRVYVALPIERNPGPDTLARQEEPSPAFLLRPPARGGGERLRGRGGGGEDRGHARALSGRGGPDFPTGPPSRSPPRSSPPTRRGSRSGCTRSATAGCAWPWTPSRRAPGERPKPTGGTASSTSRAAPRRLPAVPGRRGHRLHPGDVPPTRPEPRSVCVKNAGPERASRASRLRRNHDAGAGPPSAATGRW